MQIYRVVRATNSPLSASHFEPYDPAFPWLWAWYSRRFGGRVRPDSFMAYVVPLRTGRLPYALVCGGRPVLLSSTDANGPYYVLVDGPWKFTTSDGRVARIVL